MDSVLGQIIKIPKRKQPLIAKNIAPGEEKQPKSISNDEFCEKFVFPYPFPAGKFGYRVQRDVKVITVKYFNQRPLHYSQNFAAESDYIFLARKVLENVGL